MKNDKSNNLAIRVSVASIVGNIALTVFKLFAGIFSNSSAMISDAIHSASDVLSTFIVIIGVKISQKESDKEHPYGHERMECVAAIVLAFMLFIVGLVTGYNGVIKIIKGNYEILPVPGILALVAAIVSIIVKEAMYQFTMRAANKVNSSALKADAWHHRSDALSSIGSFIGILGSRLGAPVLDSVACVVICIFILKAAVEIFCDATNKMVDRSCDDKFVEEIKNEIAKQDGVMEIDQLKTRLFGDKIYVDVEISVNGECTLIHAHSIAQNVRDAIIEKNPMVKQCMVHVNPYGSEEHIY